MSCYFGRRSTLCYLLLKGALGQGIPFVANAVLKMYANSPPIPRHRRRGRPSCRLGLSREDSSLLLVSWDICKPSSILSLLALNASSLGGRCTTNIRRKAILIVSTAWFGLRPLRFGQLLIQSILPPLYGITINILKNNSETASSEKCSVKCNNFTRARNDSMAPFINRTHTT